MAELSSITIAQFWSRVDVGSARVCWLWRANTDDGGYGRFSMGVGHEEKAHRIAWQIVNGPIPADALILHSCDVRHCCNPRHLRPGTYQDNSDDCVSRGRQARVTGDRNPRTKISDDQVRAIRLDPRTNIALAKEYGVSDSLISMIRSAQRRTTL